MREWDTRRWEEDISDERSLSIYRKYNKDIKGEENLYDNTQASITCYTARTNNLPLNDTNRDTGGNVACNI